jgi:hypothetical protein
VTEPQFAAPFRLYRDFVKDQLELWQGCSGARIRETLFGTGTIVGMHGTGLQVESDAGKTHVLGRSSPHVSYIALLLIRLHMRHSESL